MSERIVVITISESNSSLPETLRKQQDFHRALGYAAMWGNSDKVCIHIDKDGDLNTSHQRNIGPDGNGAPVYQQYFFMLGLRNENDPMGNYSFHS